MKLRASLSTLALVASLAAPAAAAELWLGPNGGVGIPFGNLSDVASTGFNLGIHGTWLVSEQFGFGGDIGWQGYGGNDDYEKDLTALAGSSVDFKLRVLPFVAFAEYRLPPGSSLTPFVRAGAGLYHLRAEAEGGGTTSSSSRTKFGFNVGGGVHGTLTETIGWSAEALYHYVLDASDDNGESSAGSLLALRGKLSFAVMK